jgi:hypothetical protein
MRLANPVFHVLNFFHCHSFDLFSFKYITSGAFLLCCAKTKANTPVLLLLEEEQIPFYSYFNVWQFLRHVRTYQDFGEINSSNKKHIFYCEIILIYNNFCL